MTRRWRVRPADRPTRRETGGAAKPRRMRGPSSPVPPAGGVPIPRRRQPPPTHCGASRRNGRDLIIATQPAHQPLPSLLSAAAAQAVQAIPRTDNVPRRSNSAKPAPPNLHLPAPRQGSLDRRSKRLSFPHFFLRRKKCGRRRPPPRQGETDSPPGRRNPPRAKGSLDRRSKWFSLVTFFLQKKKVTRAGARNAPACARRRNTCLSPRQGSLET